jgi:hypothetical protein
VFGHASKAGSEGEEGAERGRPHLTEVCSFTAAGRASLPDPCPSVNRSPPVACPANTSCPAKVHRVTCRPVRAVTQEGDVRVV